MKNGRDNELPSVHPPEEAQEEAIKVLIESGGSLHQMRTLD